ncbi:hypothetical protein K2173_021385 [Erythroxylum novogranatense]|uniref:Uncharacterized protein n=1 Tax=Erythroxylum novogranatense TaxID=1862640 RepID=A0AAV8TX90_9ROSI|nr:hypothetical protein K2173_021385 [Erythroxylum novogranatense]
MANLGARTKFVSVNLNKSYGQQQQYSFGSNRNQSGGAGGGGGNGGAFEASQFTKGRCDETFYSTPLSLPSLRKENEKFYSLRSEGGPTGSGSGTSWVRPSSSGMGWTKLVVIAAPEKDGLLGIGRPSDSVNEVSKGNSSSLYMPPSVRSVGPAGSGLSVTCLVPEKATIFRGEDFPSLKAALPMVSTLKKKQKDGLNKKQKQVLNEDKGYGQGFGSGLSALIDMRPQMQSRNGSSNATIEKVGDKREEYFPEPLPLVRLNHKSNWANDEWDTRLDLMDRGIDHGITRSKLTRKWILISQGQRWQRDNEAGKIASSEVAKYSYFSCATIPLFTNTSMHKNVKSVLITLTPNQITILPFPSGVGCYREGSSRRVSQHLTVNGFGTQEGHNERSGTVVRPSSQNMKTNDTGRRDVGYGHGGRLPLINKMDYFSGFGNEQSRNPRSNNFQNSPTFKSSCSLGGKGLPVNDPILNIGREKPSRFNGHDPFDGPFVSLVKRKKDVLKKTNIHDPIRESFKAELERQERAIELARREKEERIQLTKEQREQQRRLEEETREAEWRDGKEILEAIQKAKEQRIAREEEKRRILIEEERRKQSVKQKLLELEERIAKRQAKANKFDNNNSFILSDEKMSERVRETERDASKSTNTSEWEDGERMVERIKTSTSTNSLRANRAFDMSSRPLLSRDDSSTFLDRGKHHRLWKQDAPDSGNNLLFLSNDQENGHHSPRCDPSIGGRVFSTKETIQDLDVFPLGVFIKEGFLILIKLISGIPKRFGDGGWSRSHSRDGVYPPYHERVYRNSKADKFYPFGRSQYSMRQPRGLPPPSMNSLQRNSYKSQNKHLGPSTFAKNELQYNDRARKNIVESQKCDLHDESTENEAQKMDREATRCPPDSLMHLSHDDLDESGDFPILTSDRKDETFALQVNESTTLPTDGGKDKLVGGLICDDEEWPIENGNSFQEQEEHDEDEDAYGEEDEVHDTEDKNVSLDREFGDHLKEKGLPDMTDNLVLGFNEGVKVRMPNDKFERSLGNEDENFVTPLVLLEMEAKKKMQDLVIQPKNAPQNSAASEVMNLMDAYSAGLSSQAQIPSTGQTVASTIPSFGLFSGPSLTPSPVPAIQIVTIQMPLHLHSLIAQSVTYVLLALIFFLLQYTSPISQGVFPLASQFMPFGNLSCSSNQNLRTELGFQTEDTSMKNLINLLTKESGGQPQTVSASLQSVANGKDSGLENGQGMITGGRRKRYIFMIINSKGSRVRNVSRRVTTPNRQAKQAFESDGVSSQLVVQETNYGTKVEKGAIREPLRKNKSHPRGYVDTSLQSGIIRVFEQPSIEAPSDDDDFIEQREKEIKAKSRTSKTMWKFRPGSQTAGQSITSSKLSASVCGGDSSNTHTEFVATEGHGLGNVKVSVGFGAPVVSQPLPLIRTPMKNDVQTEIRSQVIKTIRTSSLPVLTGGRKNLSLGLKFENKNKVLDNVQTSLSAWVVTLTHTQFDEAMKPRQFDLDSAVGDHTNSIGEPSLTPSSILTKDKSFAYAPIPINCFLGINLICIIPPSSCSVVCGIGPLGACRSDIQMTHNLSATVNQCSLFLGKDNHSNEFSVPLEDCEVEAEAAANCEAAAEVAASAVAIAIAAISSDEIIWNGLGTSLGSSPDSKNFEAANANGHSCSQMLSHIPRGTPSHFPLYEMNLMLRGSILAFRPHSDNTPVLGSHGTWQHHSGVDSFYGPPACFTAPFISPIGSIPGVQGPPHMVVYNHFTLVGQFGQVGLSVMAMGSGEGEMNNLNFVFAQRNATNIPAPWSHVLTSPLQSVSISMPLQQQSKSVHDGQFNHGHSIDQSLTTKNFAESQMLRPFDNDLDATVNQLPDELGLEASNSNNAGTSTHDNISKSQFAITVLDAGKTQSGSASNSCSQNTSSALKTRPPQSHKKNASTQHFNSSSHNYQRNSSSSGGQWSYSHRRTRYQGRTQPLSREQNFLCQR